MASIATTSVLSICIQLPTSKVAKQNYIFPLSSAVTNFQLTYFCKIHRLPKRALKSESITITRRLSNVSFRRIYPLLQYCTLFCGALLRWIICVLLSSAFHVVVQMYQFIRRKQSLLFLFRCWCCCCCVHISIMCANVVKKLYHTWNWEKQGISRGKSRSEKSATLPCSINQSVKMFLFSSSYSFSSSSPKNCFAATVCTYNMVVQGLCYYFFLSRKTHRLYHWLWLDSERKCPRNWVWMPHKTTEKITCFHNPHTQLCYLFESGTNVKRKMNALSDAASTPVHNGEYFVEQNLSGPEMVAYKFWCELYYWEGHLVSLNRLEDGTS